jgi:hypothetical protein
VAFVANGTVEAHQEYLALGGLGFLLGDGNLTYGPEKIVEAFYTARIYGAGSTSLSMFSTSIIPATIRTAAPCLHPASVSTSTSRFADTLHAITGPINREFGLTNCYLKMIFKAPESRAKISLKPPVLGVSEQSGTRK